MLPTLETERLRLRHLCAGDEDFLARLDADPRVMEHIHTGPLTPEEAREFARSEIGIAEYRSHWGKWLVESRADGEPVGWVMLGKLSGDKRDDLQVGYQFAPEHWGRGYATESVRRLIDYGLTECDLDRIAALARPANTASLRVLDKCGFHAAGQRQDWSGHWCMLLFASRTGRILKA